MFPRGESASILQLSAVSVGQRLNIIHLLSRLLTETQDLYILSPSPRLSKLFKYRLDWKQEELWSLKKKKKKACTQRENLAEVSRATSDLQCLLEQDRKSQARKGNCWR